MGGFPFQANPQTVEPVVEPGEDRFDAGAGLLDAFVLAGGGRLVLVFPPAEAGSHSPTLEGGSEPPRIVALVPVEGAPSAGEPSGNPLDEGEERLAVMDGCGGEGEGNRDTVPRRDQVPFRPVIPAFYAPRDFVPPFWAGTVEESTMSRFRGGRASTRVLQARSKRPSLVHWVNRR